MERLTIARWTVDVDRSATEEAYASLDGGSADRCGCDDCLTFIAARDSLFPESVVQFLEMAGIPRESDIELASFGEIREGVQLYSGWYHFVGCIIAGDDAAIPYDDGRGWSYDLAKVTEAFSLGVTKRVSQRADAFPPESTLQFEFAVELPLGKKKE